MIPNKNSTNVLAVRNDKNARRSSRIEMAARIENMIGKMKMSIIFSILHSGPFSFLRHCMHPSRFSQIGFL
jgi:hypothetical protein